MDYPFDIVGLNGENIDTFHETYKTLKGKFNIELTGVIDFHLEDFEVFKNCQEIIVRDSYVVKQAQTDSYILFVETCHKALGSKSGFTHFHEYQTWGLAYLKHDFGRVMIRPETFTDKILELIHPIELDFAEDKAFSDTFYVLVNDHQKAIAGIDRNFRNAVMDIREDDFMIEIVNHTLIIGNRKPISPEKAIYLAEFVVRLCSIC